MALVPDDKPNLWYRWAKVIIRSPNIGSLHLDYDQLDMYFRVSKTFTRDANKCDIEVYNLSKETRDMINQYCVVMVEAGYKYGIHDIIFRGEVTQVYTVEGGTDACTHILCIDNTRTALDTHFASHVYPKGTTFVQIIQDEIKAWNAQTKADPRFNAANVVNERRIDVGKIEDPNAYYAEVGIGELVGRFRLEKDETKTQTPYGNIWDIVDRTNGIIWGGERSTITDKESKRKTAQSKQADKRVSWTFYLTEGKWGQPSLAYYVKTTWRRDEPVTLSAENGLLEYYPDDYLVRSKGWTGKCLLNPQIDPDTIIYIKPSPTKEWAKQNPDGTVKSIALRVKEVVHEHADGGVFYTTFKGEPYEDGAD